MALAWKAGWVNSPQGFESPILRQPRDESSRRAGASSDSSARPSAGRRRPPRDELGSEPPLARDGLPSRPANKRRTAWPTHLRRLLQEHVSIREAAELIGVPYHEARRLIGAAE